MDLSNIPIDAEGIKKFKQEMHEAGIDEIEIGFPPPGFYEHPTLALPYVKSIKYRNTSPIAHSIWHGPQMIFDLSISRWNFREGKNTWEILDLSQAWPKTDTQ